MAKANKQLEEVREMVKRGKRKQAVAMLATLIEKDHDNPELWWYLANITDDPHQARRALDQMESLTPKDARIDKLRKKIETRQLLSEMGVAQQKPVNSRSRVLVFGAVAAIILIVAAGIIFSMISRSNDPNLIAGVPTELTLPTLTATEAPTETATEEPTIAPTEAVAEATEAVEPTQNLAPEATEDQVSQSESNAPTQIAQVQATLEPMPLVTVDTAPPSLTPDPTLERINSTSSILPEQTQDPSIPLPEGTDEVTPGEQLNSIESLVTNTPQAIMSNAIDQGQIVVGEPRRMLIDPYGEHTFTFSGYRNEAIILELVNITGQGNPSLQLIDSSGTVVAQDIDLTSGNNIDARIELNLPADGIFTAIVRMAAVEEQLYSLTLTRQ